jgi:hypothetical protein
MKIDFDQFNNLSFKALDIRELTGLTYRQLNHWEKLGILPMTRESKSSERWRQFNISEFFAIIICVELRKRFGASLEVLKWVRTRLLQPQAIGPFDYSIKMVQRYGFEICLLTDFRSLLIVGDELEIKQYINAGQYCSQEFESFVFLKLKKILNTILSFILKKSVTLEPDSEIFTPIKNITKIMLNSNKLSPEEKELLVIIKNRKFGHLEIRLQDGTLKAMKATAEIPIDGKNAEAQIMEHLRKHDFQTLSIIKQDGKLIRMVNEIPPSSIVKCNT